PRGVRGGSARAAPATGPRARRRRQRCFPGVPWAVACCRGPALRRGRNRRCRRPDRRRRGHDRRRPLCTAHRAEGRGGFMTDEENRPVRRRVTLTGISSRAWEHPADRGALTALRELRGFDDLIKTFFGMWNERGFRLQFLAGAIRVDHRQYPRVYQRFTEAAQTLDVVELPELYVS